MASNRKTAGSLVSVFFPRLKDAYELPTPFSLSVPPAVVCWLFILVLVASGLEDDSCSVRHHIFVTGRRKEVDTVPTISLPHVRRAKIPQKLLSGISLPSYLPEWTPWLCLTTQEAGRVCSCPASLVGSSKSKGLGDAVELVNQQRLSHLPLLISRDAS